MAGRRAVSVRGLFYARLADHCASIGMPISTFVEMVVAEKHPPPPSTHDDAGVAHTVDTISDALCDHFREIVKQGVDASSTVRQHQQFMQARRRLQMMARVRGTPGIKLRELTKLLVEIASE